jgi:hypothetical protein
MGALETGMFLGIRFPIPRMACNPVIFNAGQSRRKSETCKGAKTGLYPIISINMQWLAPKFIQRAPGKLLYQQLFKQERQIK